MPKPKRKARNRNKNKGSNKQETPVVETNQQDAPVEPTSPQSPPTPPPTREELLARMRRKKMEMHWTRMSRTARDAEVDRIEERLEGKISGKERMILKDKLSMLEDIEFREMQNSNLGEFVEYSEQ